ncbi:MAG: SRPBCC family protein [Phenylobacterium sp.]|nr:SRPBCC family protein [Phenylobacterium sp.]MBP7650401.1 SRPBCC family protein [Phenylobacterium sp.]
MKSMLVLALSALAAPALAAPAFDAAPTVSAKAEGGSAGVIRAAMDVAAPPAVVWKVLSDCAAAPRYMPKLLSCKTLERDPAGKWDVREHRLEGNAFKPVMRNVFRTTLEPPRRLAFHRTGGDWKRSDGEWRLSPIPGGTHVTYELHVAIDAPVPAGMVRSAVAKGMPASMLALRKEALAQAPRS